MMKLEVQRERQDKEESGTLSDKILRPRKAHHQEKACEEDIERLNVI